jgi:gliding motility-associated-like protein
VVSTSGTYLDTLVSSGGCDSIITTQVNVLPPKGSTQAPVICSDSSFVLPGGATVSLAGTYKDTLTSSSGCDSIVTTNLTVNPAPTAAVSAGTSVLYGTSTTLVASGGNSYVWSPTTGLNNTTGSSVIAHPTASTVYCVTVTNSNGCTDVECISITVEIICGEFYLPNAFSPNEDGENDVYKAYINPLCVSDFQLVIYNRWGQTVFETSNVNEGWNGEVEGQISNTAVYAYFCKAKLNTGTEIVRKGNISLIR